MISPAQILSFAESLKDGDEASLRAAVSRAYYASFHAIQDAVYPMGKDSDFGDFGSMSHGATLRSLRDWRNYHPERRARMTHGADALKMFHRLTFLKNARELADYGIQAKFTQKDFSDAISRARVVAAFGNKVCPCQPEEFKSEG